MHILSIKIIDSNTLRSFKKQSFWRSLCMKIINCCYPLAQVCRRLQDSFPNSAWASIKHLPIASLLPHPRAAFKIFTLARTARFMSSFCALVCGFSWPNWSHASCTHWGKGSFKHCSIFCWMRALIFLRMQSFCSGVRLSYFWMIVLMKSASPNGSASKSGAAHPLLNWKLNCNYVQCNLMKFSFASGF